jgi:soluble P-type ATPase
MVWNENCITFAVNLNQNSMNEKTLYKTSEFVSFLKDMNVNVVVDSNPDSSTIERIKKLIAKKRALFEFQKSLFN